MAGLWFIAAIAYANPLGVIMTRTHAPVYEPGKPLVITVTIEAAVADGLLAMGIYETLPEGWRWMGMNAEGNGMPAILPAPGDGPRLEFAWISPPPLSCSFSYVVMPPEDNWGGKEIHGVLEYRMQEGPYYLPDTVTALEGPQEAKPVLMLRGGEEIEIMQGESWEDPGYSALDSRLQDISSRVVITGNVLTDTPGTYTLRYSVSSESSRQTAEAVRIVRVLSATERTMVDTAAAEPGGASELLPEMRERIVQRLAPAETVALVDEGENGNSGGKPRAELQLPNPDVLRPVVPIQDEYDTQEAATDLGLETSQEEEMSGQKEDTDTALVKRNLNAFGEANRVSLSRNQKEPVVDYVQQKKDIRHRYMLLGMAGLAAAGVITGAWFALRGERRAGHTPVKKGQPNRKV